MQDFSADVSNQAKPLLMRIRELVRERIQYGPGATVISPKAALERLKMMGAEERRGLIQRTGQDEFMSQLEDLIDKAARGGR